MMYIDDDVFNHICLKNTIRSYWNNIEIVSMYNGNEALENIQNLPLNL